MRHEDKGRQVRQYRFSIIPDISAICCLDLLFQLFQLSINLPYCFPSRNLILLEGNKRSSGCADLLLFASLTDCSDHRKNSSHVQQLSIAKQISIKTSIEQIWYLQDIIFLIELKQPAFRRCCSSDVSGSYRQSKSRIENSRIVIMLNSEMKDGTKAFALLENVYFLAIL